MKKNRIHFIGIGGIGLSSLAAYFLAKGDEVRGTDLVSSEITARLKKQGAVLTIGKHLASNIKKETTFVVYSPAITTDNPELKKARKEGIKTLSYPEALGELTKKYFTIAVSGTHGKSTTTAMLALIMIRAGLDPTVIIGTKLKEFGNSNFRFGKSKYLLIEADEYQASFLNYWPQIIVATNIDNDHLDYYGSFSKVVKSFQKYFNKISADGQIVANGDDPNLTKILSPKKRVNYFSLKKKPASLVLKVPGEYNLLNGLAALETARLLGIKDNQSFQSLLAYNGSWRRFEIFKLKNKKLTLISDYGHHPTEIRVTLRATREKYPNQRIICLFQPHQQKRTFYLFDDFVRVLKEAPVELIILLPIYDVAGREERGIRVDSGKLALAVGSKALYLKTNDLLKYLLKNLKEKDILIFMGAGDIYNLFLKIKKRLMD